MTDRLKSSLSSLTQHVIQTKETYFKYLKVYTLGDPDLFALKMTVTIHIVLLLCIAFLSGKCRCFRVTVPV